MSNPSSSRASFWKEALPAIKVMLQTRWMWIAGFILILLAGHLLALSAMPSSDTMAQLKANPNFFKDHPELRPSAGVWGIGALVACVSFILLIAANYIFPAFYLQIVAKSSPPKLSIGGFFFWLWKSIQKFLLWILVILAIELVVGAGLGIISVIFSVAKLPKIAVVPIIFIGVVAIFVFSFYVYFRLSLVTPLAILGKTPVIKKSRDLTKGQCWRIFCGAFILFWMFCGIFMVPFFILLAGQIQQMIDALHGGNMSAFSPIFDRKTILFMDILQSVLAGVHIMTSAVYQCTVLRIILREQRNTQSPASI